MRKANGRCERFYYRELHKHLMTDVIVIHMADVAIIHQVNM